MKENHCLLLITLLILFSCNNDKNYDRLVKRFVTQEERYDSIVTYLQRNYINVLDRANLSRKIILLCDGKNRFDSSDSRFCDSTLEPIMKDIKINLINIEKDICFRDKNFDLIIFELGGTNERAYYYYRLCESTENVFFEDNNIITIPLKKNWLLFIEK